MDTAEFDTCLMSVESGCFSMVISSVEDLHAHMKQAMIKLTGQKKRPQSAFSKQCLMRRKAIHQMRCSSPRVFGKRRHRPARVRGLVVKATRQLTRTTDRRGGLSLKKALLNARLKRKPNQAKRSRTEYLNDRAKVKQEVDALPDDMLERKLARHTARTLAKELDSAQPAPGDPSEAIQYSPLGIGSAVWPLAPAKLRDHLAARERELGINATATQALAAGILKDQSPKSLSNLTIGRQAVADKNYDIDGIDASRLASKICFDLHPGLCIAVVGGHMTSVRCYHSWMSAKLRCSMGKNHIGEGFELFACVPSGGADEDPRILLQAAVIAKQVQCGFV